MTPSFNIERKGYDRQEVDLYIDKVNDEYANLLKEYKKLETERNDLSIDLEKTKDALRDLNAKLRAQEYILQNVDSQRGEQETQAAEHKKVQTELESITSEYQNLAVEFKKVQTQRDKITGEYERQKELSRSLEDKLQAQGATLLNQEDISRALIAAQSLARQTEQETSDKAAVIIHQAQQQAERILTEANSESNKILASANYKVEEAAKQTTIKLNDVKNGLHQIYLQILPLMERGAEIGGSVNASD
jgi:cell division septum initiation protein DivIVA